jgi:hypothetical protein
MVFENLSIELGADTGDLQAGLAAAREAVDDTADEFSRLGRKADNAEEDLGDAGRQAATTGGIFTALSLSTSGLSLSLGTLSTTLTGATIPALIALSTTLVPLAATVGGLAAGAGSLAAAFGLVAGSGAAAFAATNDLEKVFKQLREEILGILAEFGEQFLPLIEDAIDAFPDLVENILDATGNLSAFRNALRDFGQAAFRLLPRITDRVFDLARRALPVLIDGVEFLLNNGGNIFDGILSTTREIAPLLLSLSQTFADILPTINDVGTTVLNVVVPALEDFLGAINKLLQGDIEGGLIEPIKGIINDVVTFLNSEEAQTQLDKVSSAFFNATADALDNTSESDIAGVANALGSATVKALRTLTENFKESGLGAAIGVFTSKALSKITQQLAKASTSDEFQQDLQVIGGNIGSALGDAIIASVKETLTNFNLTAAGSAFVVKKTAQATGGDGERQRRLEETSKVSDIAGGEGEFNQSISVTVEGDRDVVESVSAEITDQKLQEQRDRAVRNAGRGQP